MRKYSLKIIALVTLATYTKPTKHDELLRGLLALAYYIVQSVHSQCGVILLRSYELHVISGQLLYSRICVFPFSNIAHGL